MSFDVACVGVPFLDVTFAGLERVPEPGEELFADDVAFSPGGMGTIAIALARLGLATVLVAPVASDLAARFLREALEAEGVGWEGPEAPRSAVTVVLPLRAEAGQRAMATYEPLSDSCAPTLRRLSCRAAVAGLDRLDQVPEGVRLYAVGGDSEARAFAGSPPPALARARAVVVNEREALLLTGAARAEDAAAELGRLARTAVVTLGADGALGAEAGELLRVPAPRVEARDTTGAGDLFAAAHVWADLADFPLGERLRWSTLHASLSVGAYTAVAGARTLSELLEAGRQAGLTEGSNRVEGRWK